ncbi:pre-peptidase C-terminal domain-containing protein [Microcoleus sp. AT3-D2]|uniref:pre-peptidase C-terminal domain-containing protein n=1 Tax=Microcoleus sp. AT3-D2 TaxID=2818612 RepID=UPI002FD3A808
MSNFFTPEFNNESAIGPWNASLEPTKAIIPQLDANRVLTGGVGQEVNLPTLTPEAYDNIILPDAALTRMANGAIADSNSSLPDSSVDLLTGHAMSEVYGNLSKFAAAPDFVAKMNLAFGENWDAAGAKALAEGWFHGDFSDIPSVKVVSSAEIAGANGAFAAATDTIYLSKGFLAGNAMNPGAVADVLLEEVGHSVDARLNVTDSPGDEGAIFGAIVQGKGLSQGELQGLKSEDDTATVLLDGHQYLVEKQLNPAGSIGSFYNRNPAIAQALGQPTGAEYQFVSSKWRQNFQNGAIFHSAQGTYSVRGSLGRHYLNLGGQNSQLGLPTSEESYVGNWRQSFEKGTLEWLNNGTPRITITPVGDGNDTLNTAQVFNAWFGENTAVESTNKGGSIGGSDLNDYYRFSLNNTRQVNLTLNGLQADAELQLLDKNGTSIQRSTNSGTSAESITRTLNAGEYFIRVYPYGNAITNYQVNLTLTTLPTPKVGNPDIDIQLSYPKGGFTQSQMNQMEKAAQNWERIITKDKASSGVLKISVVQAPTDVAYYVAQTNQESASSSRTNFSGPNVDINGVDYHNNIRFNPNHFSRMVNNNLLVRLTMHEIGHTLGLDHESVVSLMNHSNFDSKMTDSMYNTLTAQGYGIDRNVPINWS